MRLPRNKYCYARDGQRSYCYAEERERWRVNNPIYNPVRNAKRREGSIAAQIACAMARAKGPAITLLEMSKTVEEGVRHGIQLVTARQERWHVYVGMGQKTTVEAALDPEWAGRCFRADKPLLTWPDGTKVTVQEAVDLGLSLYEIRGGQARRTVANHRECRDGCRPCDVTRWGQVGCRDGEGARRARMEERRRGARIDTDIDHFVLYMPPDIFDQFKVRRGKRNIAPYFAEPLRDALGGSMPMIALHPLKFVKGKQGGYGHHV